jgi:hypothetical protein
MTEPYARLSDAASALENPSLALLRQKIAPAVLATLTPIFESGQSSVPVDEFHTRAAQVFAALRDRDDSFSMDPDDPKQVRDECRDWVDRDWLERHGEAHGEVYRISPEAREAIRIVGVLGRARAAMSESQVAAVLTRARDLALKVTFDPDARMRGLREEMEDLESKLADRRAELDALEAGAAVEAPDDYVVLGEFLSLREEIDRLPHDLRRVEDEFRSLAQALRNDFLSEVRPHGEIVGEYLGKADVLATVDRYGRGFQSAKRLLTDDHAQDQLRHHLATIVGYQFADDPLNERDRSDLRQTIHLVTRSVSAVLDQRDVLIERLVGFISRHDAQRERELHEAIRAAKNQLRHWAEANTPRATVALPVGHNADCDDDPDGPVLSSGEVGVADIATFRERPVRKRVPTPLASLSESSGNAAPTFSVEELRAMGGPFYPELADAIENATHNGQAIGAAALFNSLPERTRRPVDIFGLVDLAAKQRALRPNAPVEEFHAVRADGTADTFLLPEITFVSTAPPRAEDPT